ncbi:MFS transporter [Paenibacillus sp. MAH-36]|uniref:MFS transporter n=1 Tax=Paenibacillus violae TaxID=3077234 RepID=A0ABU3RR63_9BACL|nr:MFS transporter [Paenibacillus sp. PFR10]MDU0206469.1 MFS transporter [Paenibacillus sp. PFR10]
MRIRDWDRNLKFRLGVEFAFNVVFWTFLPFLAIFFANSFGKGWAGLLLVLSQALSVAGNLLGGYSADRWGRKRMMVLAACIQGIGYGIFAIAASSWVSWPLISYLGFTLASFAGSLYSPASEAMVADVVEEKHRSSIFAVFWTSTNLAVVFGPALGAVLFKDSPYILLLVASVFCLLISAVLNRGLRETLPHYSPVNPRKKDDGPCYKFLAEQLRGYRIIASDQVFLLFIIAGVLLALTFMQLDILFPVFFKETIPSTDILGFGGWHWVVSGQQLFGLIVSEFGLFVALFTVSVTKWMTSYKDRYVFIGGALLYAIGMVLFSESAIRRYIGPPDSARFSPSKSAGSAESRTVSF